MKKTMEKRGGVTRKKMMSEIVPITLLPGDRLSATLIANFDSFDYFDHSSDHGDYENHVDHEHRHASRNMLQPGNFWWRNFFI